VNGDGLGGRPAAKVVGGAITSSAVDAWPRALAVWRATFSTLKTGSAVADCRSHGTRSRHELTRVNRGNWLDFLEGRRPDQPEGSVPRFLAVGAGVNRPRAAVTVADRTVQLDRPLRELDPKDAEQRRVWLAQHHLALLTMACPSVLAYREAAARRPATAVEHG
jgi:hypothetical protein